jgi:NitT/TauT family transport system ATP-binding protein
MKLPKIALQHVGQMYDNNKHKVIALQDLNLEVFANEIFCLVGPSGCGKTTTLNLVAGFVAPTSGTILEDGQAISGLNPKSGVVFQADSVFPWMTIEQNVGYGIKPYNPDPGETKKVVHKYLSLMGLEDFGGSWPRELSAGMKKRVELARAYAFNPEILLLDEPFGTLDVLTKEEMQMLLFNIWQTEKKTVLFVTHDVEEALFLGHRVAVMTKRPGSIKRVFNIPFDIPRDPSLKLTPQFLDLRREIINTLKAN